MRTVLKASGMVVLLAVVILTAAPVAHSTKYCTTYYDINYYSSTQYKWAKGLAPYLSRAFWAAKTTIGYDARIGKINIYFSYSNPSALGWMYSGFQRIYLSRANFTSYYDWGSVLAHETAHVLFYNYTKAHLWNGSLLYYRTFLTESLSWYAGDYVYKYNRYSRSSAYNQIRANLQYYYYAQEEDTRKHLSWYDSGYYYRNGTGDNTNLWYQNIWQLKAIGWYLTGGRLTSSSPNVKKLLYTMRTWTSRWGYRLRSYNSSTALAYFESAFQYAYGARANSAWQYTGSKDEAYKNTSYLYGRYWYQFYN